MEADEKVQALPPAFGVWGDAGVKIFFKEGVSHFLDALPGSEGMKSFVWRGVTICLDLQGAGSFMQRRSSRILSCFTLTNLSLLCLPL